MTTATLRISTPIAAAPAAPGKSFLSRLYAAFIEARMRAALRELEMHKHLLPEHQLKAAGYKATASNDGALPFTK